MENNFKIVLLLLSAAICVQGNYLDGLRVLQIDQCLIDQANFAIIDLKDTLKKNFQC
jgi:hypothetical protein